jgi:pimeloyl-ACP methyl ester carboxylesterase
MLQRLLTSTAARFDVAVVRVAQELAKRATKRVQGVDERRAYLEAVGESYGKADPAAFFAEPPAPAEVHEHRVRTLEDGDVVDLSFASEWKCHTEEQAQRFSRWRENSNVHVRLLRHRKPGAPAVICIHGYRAGTFKFEERAWAATWLHRLGLDVALFTLPFHALRAPNNRRNTPLFPTADVARTNEAFGQAMWDLRRLAKLLRARGAPSVGVMGMSLGGYTTSLLATVDGTLEFAVPFIPLADLTDVVVDHEALRGVTVPDDLIEAGKRALTLVRPLARVLTISADRVLVVGAEGDRITKRSHAEALAGHFRSELVVFPGAHLLQFGRRDAFASIAKVLARRGVIAPRA